MIQFLRRHVLHNLLLKIISLVAATLLWVAVARDPVAEVAMKVPIEFQHVPDGIEISSETIPDVQIRLRGPGRMLRTMGASDIHADIDLSNARPGERTYELTPPHIRVPRNVQVVQVVPAQLQLAFDYPAKREVDIKPRVFGLYQGGRRAEVSVEPATALIAGPWKRVHSIDTVLTDPVDASGVVGRATFPGVRVYAADPLVRVVQPAAVTVTIDVVSGTKNPTPGR